MVGKGESVEGERRVRQDFEEYVLLPMFWWLPFLFSIVCWCFHVQVGIYVVLKAELEGSHLEKE